MKSGEVVMTIPGGFVVKFQGHIAGQVNAYRIETKTGWESFNGTTDELLTHCAGKVKAHNDSVRKFGGTLI